MKDYRNPVCQRFCGTFERIGNIRQQAEAIEIDAVGDGCISSHGEVNCIGPIIQATDDKYFVRTLCQATCETPDIIHYDDINQAHAFEQRIIEVMGQVFNIKYDK